MSKMKICTDDEGKPYTEMMFDRMDTEDISELFGLRNNPELYTEVKDIDEDYVYLNVWGLL